MPTNQSIETTELVSQETIDRIMTVASWWPKPGTPDTEAAKANLTAQGWTVQQIGQDVTAILVDVGNHAAFIRDRQFAEAHPAQLEELDSLVDAAGKVNLLMMWVTGQLPRQKF